MGPITISLVAALACAPAGGEGGELVVLSDYANPPFALMREGADGPVGLEVDLMREVARRLGRRWEWKRLPFAELIPGVVAGRGDVAAATLGVTAERERLVLFSRPYYETTLALVVRGGEGSPGDPAELAGRRVGASEGTTSEDALRRSLNGAVPVLVPDEGATFAEMLERGTLDAAIMDGPAAERLIAASSGRLRKLADLAIERYAIAVSRERPELRAAIDRVLAELEAEGTILPLQPFAGPEHVSGHTERPGGRADAEDGP